MRRKDIQHQPDIITASALARIFARTGATSFGGWSTTVVLLEKEFEKRDISVDLKAAAAYAQILPGATQVAIVSNVGYQLRGFKGAILATVSYLLPVLVIIIGFAALYFRFAHGSNFANRLDGLVAALGGVILANAYRIGSKHVNRPVQWLFVAAAVAAQFLFHIHALLIILSFGAFALISYWLQNRPDRSTK